MFRKEDDSLLWHGIFIKKTKIFTMFCSFLKFSKLVFLKYNIISLAEAKMQIFNIHIGYVSQKYSLQTKFSYALFCNNLDVLY